MLNTSCFYEHCSKLSFHLTQKQEEIAVALYHLERGHFRLQCSVRCRSIRKSAFTVFDVVVLEERQTRAVMSHVVRTRAEENWSCAGNHVTAVDDCNFRF